MNSFVKEFFTDKEYQSKRISLFSGIFMIAVGLSFVVPIFSTLGIVWTTFATIYTVIIVIRILIKASDNDNVADEIQERNKVLDGIEGERADISLYTESEVDEEQRYRLMRLAKAFDAGRITAEEFEKRRNDIMQDIY